MKLPTIKDQKKLAKVALPVALGVTALSGFVYGKTARRVHVLAGVATVGLAAWHHLLYTAPEALPSGDQRAGVADQEAPDPVEST